MYPQARLALTAGGSCARIVRAGTALTVLAIASVWAKTRGVFHSAGTAETPNPDFPAAARHRRVAGQPAQFRVGAIL
jgi:hypothetical protein